MTTFIIITHDDTIQDEYKQFLIDLGSIISTDYSAIPTMYKVEAGHIAADAIRKNKQTMSLHIADSEVKKHVDEVGLRIKTSKIIDHFKKAGSTIQILDIKRQQDNWGLGRIDQRDAIVPVDASKANLAKFNDESNSFKQLFIRPAVSPDDGTLVYEYAKTGVSVDAYVIDSGIRADHVEFSGRVNELWSAFGHFDDDGGHGTHVASTIGGEKFGVAKDVTLHNVKVFGPEGTKTTLSMIIDAMNEVLKHHKNKIENGIKRGSVVNMSLTGPSSALGSVASELKKNGIIVVAAAGNDSSNLNTSYTAYPAESPDVITVVSSNNIDRPSYFNNYGDTVDIFAPGSGIVAAGHHAVDGISSMSGTSMATPHVAGVVALALEGKRALTNYAEAHQVTTDIIAATSKDKIIFDQDFVNEKNLFKNRLVYSKLTVIINDTPVVVPPKEEKSKKTTFIVVGAVAVIGLIIAVIAMS